MIRPYRNTDLAKLYVINQASVPGVGSESEDSLAKWIGLSTCLVACDEADQPLGFITLIPTGTAAYTSANLRWLEAYAARDNVRLIYVDRIALDPDTRGLGLGAQLYQAAFEAFDDHDKIGCEVNTLPPNPGSHRFHQRLGFEKIGERSFQDGAKSVAYYTRKLR